MRLRRVLVMIAVGMLVLTLLAALSAPREEKADEPVAPPSGPVEPPQPVSLRHPPADGPPVRRVRRGARVILRVSSTVPGQVEVRALGLLQPVDPNAPATFDVLATRPGRYRVDLLPVDGERSLLGTVVVG